MSVHHDFIWSILVHLGTNMWYEEGNDRGNSDGSGKTWKVGACTDLRFDRATWDAYLARMKKSGVNTIVLDIGEALAYESHPELAVNGSWTRAEMAAELVRLEKMDFEVIPKLNFSACHDTWMKDYSRMLSTPIYYQVCKDLINEVCEIFKPRYFHIGMDEEVYENQQFYDYVAIRQNDLWWHDLYYLVNCVEEHGARAMIWSDYARHRPDEFVEKCPKSVVQCVWYYFNEFGEKDLSPVCEVRVRPLDILERHGFDQLPTGSIEYYDENLRLLAEYCRDHISKEHLLGFMQTTWIAVQPQWQEMLDKSADTVRDVREWYESR